MLMRRYMRNINNILLVCFLFCYPVYANELYVEYLANKQVTISAETSFGTGNIAYTYCGLLNYVTLSVSENNGDVSSTGKTIVAQTNGNSSQNCDLAISKILPVTFQYPTTTSKVKYICISGGTLLDKFKSGHCIPAAGFTSSVGNATCTISSGDINQDYGTVLSDEAEGQSITTTGTLTCSGGTNGSTSVSLNLKDSTINLNSDNSLYATLALDGASSTTSYDIDANSSTNFSLTSTLHTNGNVSSGTFSGSSVLTLSYY